VIDGIKVGVFLVQLLGWKSSSGVVTP